MNKKTDKAEFKETGSNIKNHWEQVYSEKKSTEVSWYQQHPGRSLELIEATSVGVLASIIDIGGGASTLVDYLLAAGYQHLTVLDISHAAIEQAKSRLDNSKVKVEWIEQDITKFKTGKIFDVWHDRAVFHFLIDEKDRKTYVQIMRSALHVGSHVIIAAFDDNGPKKCSGLEVMHYSPEKMAAVLGDSFQLIDSTTENHVTPAGSSQSFVYCHFLRV